MIGPSLRQIIYDWGWLEGAMAEARRALRILGDPLLGPPDAIAVAAIEAIPNLAQLEELIQQLHTASSWQELLGQTALSRSRGRRRRAPRPSSPPGGPAPPARAQ